MPFLEESVKGLQEAVDLTGRSYAMLGLIDIFFTPLLAPRYHEDKQFVSLDQVVTWTEGAKHFHSTTFPYFTSTFNFFPDMAQTLDFKEHKQR